MSIAPATEDGQAVPALVPHASVEVSVHDTPAPIMAALGRVFEQHTKGSHAWFVLVVDDVRVVFHGETANAPVFDKLDAVTS